MRKENCRRVSEDFNIICADQSMNRPGFALQHYDATHRSATVQRMSDVDNKTHKKPHGQIQSEIAKELRSYLQPEPDAQLVREKAISNIATSAKTIMVLNKVVGVADLYAWGFGERVFEEIDPKTVKKLVTGDGLADKATVAKALEKYVGQQTYRTDDWSDAVAVGIAWQLQNKMIDLIDGE